VHVNEEMLVKISKEKLRGVILQLDFSGIADTRQIFSGSVDVALPKNMARAVRSSLPDSPNLKIS